MNERIIFDHLTVCLQDDGSRHEVGRGADGVTFLAFDSTIQRSVALKVVSAGTACAEAFLDGPRASAKLRHPGIAAVHHVGRDRDSLFYATELLDGETLQHYVERHGPVRPSLALRIMEQIAQALAAAERARLIHRELKPSDFMLLRGSGGGEGSPRVKLIDFSWDELEPADAEQSDGGIVELRSDIYSLGCTLWFLLTGQSPFTGLLAQTLAQQLQREPAWERVAHLPTTVRKLLRITLRRDPAERPRNASELQAAVQLCHASMERQVHFTRRVRDAAARTWRRAWHDEVVRRAIIGGVPALIMVGVLALLSGPKMNAPEPAVAMAEPITERVADRPLVREPVAVPPIAELSPIAELETVSEPSAPEPVRPLNRRPPLILPTPSDDDVPQPEFFDDVPEMIAEQEPVSYEIAPVPPKPVAKKSARTRTTQRRSTKPRDPNPFVRVHRSVQGLLARVF